MKYFILKIFNGRGIEDCNNSVIAALNKYLSGYCVLVECGIEGLKEKLCNFSALFRNRRDTVDILLTSAVILIKYLHRSRKDSSSQLELSEVGADSGENDVL